jgi:uncharacterized membrane protein YqjE
MMAQFNLRSIPDVFHDVALHIQEIIRSELILLKVELKEEGARAVQPIGRLCVGAALGLFAFGFALLTVMFLLWIVVPIWAAALIVSVLVAPVAIGLIRSGIAGLQELHLPETTIRTVREGVQWANDQIR